MRRIVLLVIAIFLVSGISAQRLLAEPTHYVGVKGGASISFVSFVPTVSQSMRYSYVGGFAYRFVSEKYFGIQLEANYAERGWKESNSDYERRLGYIEIPFLSHITFGRKFFKWYFHLGPSISFLVKEGGILESSVYPQQTMGVKSKVDYSIMGGTGFEFHTSAGVWSLEGRYSFGLGDMFSNKAGEAFKASSNQNIYVSLSWMFPLSRR